VSTFIAVNDICNLRCTFCGIRREGAAADDAVRAQLADVAGSRVTFGGGEPTLDERLPTWLALARAGGAEALVLETNGLLASDRETARRLVESGLTDVRLMLPAARQETYEAIAGQGAALEDAWAGGAQLSAAGARLSVVIPVSSTNLGELDALIDQVAQRLPGVSGLTLRPVFFSVPEGDGAHAADIRARASREMVPTADLAPALAQAIATAAERGLEVHVDAPEGLPLCALRESTAALAAVPAPRRRLTDVSDRPDACMQCAMLERCAGQNPMDRELFGDYDLHPFLRIPPALDRNTTFEPIVLRSPGLPSPGFGAGDKVEIRVVMPCNQDCTFCFVNREAPSPSLEFLETSIDEAIASGVGAVVFTGGEPTLSNHLPALIERATLGGVACRGIQTNALRLAEGPLVDQLVDAGLNHAHVSLHAADPGRYKAITGFGEPTDAARGARRLVERGVDVSISLVVCQANADHMGETLRFIRDAVGEVRVVLSVAREQLGVPRPWDQTLIRYTEAAHALVEALDLCPELGLPVDSAGTCSMPPCVLPIDALERHADALLVGHREMTWDGVEQIGAQGDHSVSNEFVAACEACALRDRCPGIQRTYLERRGAEEFRAISHWPPEA
jgi:molybdenum cofactor biosynthesis enzyme MoaA